MQTPPTEHHQWLQQMVGDWTYTSTCVMGPDGQTETFAGKETVRPLGELWVVAELEGTVPGGGVCRAMMTIGFDTLKERYVGSWAGSPMAFMFQYEGLREGDVLRLDCEGPGMEDPTVTAAYQDVIEILAADRRSMKSRLRGEDGAWMDFMTSEFTRTG